MKPNHLGFPRSQTRELYDRGRQITRANSRRFGLAVRGGKRRKHHLHNQSQFALREMKADSMRLHYRLDSQSQETHGALFFT
jgi:hypothetical protein